MPCRATIYEYVGLFLSSSCWKFHFDALFSDEITSSNQRRCYGCFENTSKSDHKMLMPSAKCQFSAEVNFRIMTILCPSFSPYTISDRMSSSSSLSSLEFFSIFDLICIHHKRIRAFYREKSIIIWCDEMKRNEMGVFVIHLGNLFSNELWMFIPIFTHIQFTGNEISKSSSNNKQLPEKW